MFAFIQDFEHIVLPATAMCAHNPAGCICKIYTKEHYCWQWSAMDHLVCKPFAVRSWCGIPW